MKLNKRYLRNIRQNLSFYLSASILTAVGLVLFFLFYIAGTGISSYGAFFAALAPEDVVVLCGGDGTLNYLINSIDTSKLEQDIYYSCHQKHKQNYRAVTLAPVIIFHVFIRQKSL